MEKKLISLLLAVLMMFSALPITVFAADSEYPESEHPYGYGDYVWIYEGKPGTKSLSVTFSDKTEFNEGDNLSFYDQNGNWIGRAGSELAGKTVDFNARSLKIELYNWNSDSSYYGFKITNIRENNYEVDGTVIPEEDCKITEDRSTGTITFEPTTTESDDGYISLSYSVLGSRTVKWVKRIVVKPGFNDTTNFGAFVNAEVLDFAEDFHFSGWDISKTAFYKNKSNWDNESLYLGNKLVILGENDKIKDGTKFICSEAIDYYKDIIIPDSVIYIGEDNNPKSIMCTKGSYAESWANNEWNYEWIECTCIGDLKIKFKNCIISKGTTLSSAIEVYKLSPDYTWKQISEYSSVGFSSDKVGAQTVTISDGEESLDFTIIISDDENQYINFNDKYLRERLWDVDLNYDGAITVDEMRSYDEDISLYRVRDISGLEYADSALFIYGWEESLVSIEDYFSLQKYDDLTVTEGKAFLSFFKNYGRERLEYYDNLLNELKVTSSNSSVVSIDKKCMNFLKIGDSVITVTLGSVSKKFTVHVTSSDCNKDLGSTIKEIPNLTSAGIVNTANGDVYQKTTSGLKKVNSGKKVLMSSFYPGRDDNNSYAYYITDNGELWKSDEKIGENFLKFSKEHDEDENTLLALDKNGNCYRLNYRLNDLELLAENVKDINDNRYLTNDGKVYYVGPSSGEPVEACRNVKSIIRNGLYIKNNGQTGGSRGCAVDHEVKDIAFLFYSASYYYIDNDDSLWLCKSAENTSAVKIASDVDRINESNWNNELLVFQTKNGDYYQLFSSDMAELNPEDIMPTLTNIKEMGVSFYLDKENNLYATKDYEGTIYSEKRIISKIMTNVTAFKESYDYGNPYNHFAVFTRTDGSVWSYTVGDEEPIKLLEGEDYTPEHTHTLNHITVPSTCKVAGMEYDICSECGETFNEKTLPLAAHTWSDWTVVKEATTTAEGQEKRICSVCDKVETRAIEKLKVLKDDKTGIEINYNDEYDSDTEIKVEEQFSGKSFQLINTEFGKVNSKIYDIATYKDGVKVQPNGEITVKVPLPDGFTTNKVFVCYVDSVSGKVTKIPCEVKDGYVIFKTNHFSEYAIVEQSANVKSVSVSDIKLNYKKSATIKPTIKADEGAKYTVKYSSSNTKVATVDENGKVYAAKKGSATITCTVTDSNGNTVQDTCKVTVKYSFGQWLIKILLFGWIWY